MLSLYKQVLSTLEQQREVLMRRILGDETSLFFFNAIVGERGRTGEGKLRASCWSWDKNYA